MAHCQQARDLIDRRTEVVGVALVGRTGVDGRTYAQSADTREILCGKGALGIGDRRRGVFRATKRRAERIADRFKNLPTVLGDRRSH